MPALNNRVYLSVVHRGLARGRVASGTVVSYVEAQGGGQSLSWVGGGRVIRCGRGGGPHKAVTWQ